MNYEVGENDDQDGIPCEFCDASIPYTEYILHVTGCRPELVSFANVLQEDQASKPLIEPSLKGYYEPTSPNSDVDANSSTQFQFPYTDIVKIPCEYCKELFPDTDIVLHESGCKSGLIHPESPTSESLIDCKPELLHPENTTSKCQFEVAVEQKVVQSTVTGQERKEKILVYGSGTDPDGDLKKENQMSKIPCNPLLDSLYKEKDIEDINNLSDDDSDETLEEFWKRAREALKRNRIKSECS